MSPHLSPHLSPHVAEALELLTARARAAQAKHARARRIYLRSLLLDESPPGGAPTLADAVEELSLQPYDLNADAHAAFTRRTCQAQLQTLHAQMRNALSASQSEHQSQHRSKPSSEDPSELSPEYTNQSPGSDPDNEQEPRPALQFAQSFLPQAEKDAQLLRARLQQCLSRAPRLFSPEAQSLLQPPPTEPPNETPAPNESLTPDEILTGEILIDETLTDESPTPDESPTSTESPVHNQTPTLPEAAQIPRPQQPTLMPDPTIPNPATPINPPPPTSDDW